MGKVIQFNSVSRENDNGYTSFLRNYPGVNLGSIIISMICILLMVIASFTMLPVGIYDPQMLVNPVNYFSNPNNLIFTLYSHLYAPQVPIAIFTGALLGPRIGTFAIAAYTGLGLLGWPLFADGGGLDYITKPSFGYLIGFILAAYLVGKILNGKINSFNIIFAGISGVITIHFVGIIYLTFILITHGNGFETVQNWIYTLSLVNLPYDLVLSVILCSLARPIRGILWLAMH